jgi:hypothetical protein
MQRRLTVSRFVLSFRSPTDRTASTDEESAWMRWFEQIGGSVADFGQRVERVSALGSAEHTRDALAGYVIIEAADVPAAVAIAKGCPGLHHGGGVEVGQPVAP